MKIDSSIIKKYNATGTKSGGVSESKAVAKKYLNRVRSIITRFQGHNMPSALLAAIALRESRCGALLDDNGYGDNGHAYGICQIDKRYHKPVGAPDSVEHIKQCDDILTSYFAQVKAKHPTWPEARQLQGAVAAYNYGVDNVNTLDGIDVGTTHNDYSNDVWAMADYLLSIE